MVVAVSGLITIGLTGRAGSGKDTAAKYLAQEYGLVPMALADPIKRVVERLHPEWSPEQIWGRYKDVPDERGLSTRALCQELGSAGRRVHEDYWLWQAEREVQMWREEVLPVTFARVRGIVWTDVRYANEARWIRQQGGEVVRIVRREAKAVRDHESEHGIPEELIDHTIPNNGPRELLWAHLHGLMMGLVEVEAPAQEGATAPDAIEGRYPWGAGVDCYE